MKRIVFSVVLCFAFLLASSCSSIFSLVPSGYAPMIPGEDNHLYSKYDAFNDITYIQHDNSFLDDYQAFGLYLAKSGGRTIPVVRLSYRGSNWIFFTTAILMNEKLERFTIEIESYNKSTDVSSTGSSVYISEKINYSIYSIIDVQKLKAVLSGGNVKIRLSGEKYIERDISPEVCAAVIELLDIAIIDMEAHILNALK